MTGSRRREAWIRVLPFLPPAALCLVAILQVYLVHTHGMSPWKGGGFGMFSTNDAENRELRIVLLEGTERTELTLPPSLLFEAQKSTTLPLGSWLDDLAHRILAAERRRDSTALGIQLQVLRTDYERGTIEPHVVVVRETTVGRAPP